MIMHSADEFGRFSQRVREFVDQRDWDQFHSPKNLAMAMIVEAGELVEHFQWLTEQQSESLEGEKLHQIELELADVLIYLVRLAQRLDVDLLEAGFRKLEQNELKYPAKLVRGDSRKYSEY